MKERKKACWYFFSGSKGLKADGLSCGGRGGENQAFELAFLTVKYCVGRAGGLAVSPPFYAAPGTRWDMEGGAGRRMPCGTRDGRGSFSRPVVDWPRGVYF